MRTATIVIPLLCLTLCAVTTNAQERSIKKEDVPKAVLEAFQKSYPHATIRGTAEEKENGVTYYEIESIDGGIHRDLLFTEDGQISEIEEGMDVDALPEAVKTSLKKEFPKYTVQRAEKTIRGMTTTIEVLVRKGTSRYEVVLDLNGRIQKKESVKMRHEKEEKEDDEDEDDDE